MNFNEYQHAAVRTAKRFPDPKWELMHAALGLATEGGEFTTEVKRMVIYDQPLTADREAHIREELGDALWYIALACEALGMSMHLVARENIDKLKKRFPETYSNAAAEARADKGGLGARES